MSLFISCDVENCALALWYIMFILYCTRAHLICCKSRLYSILIYPEAILSVVGNVFNEENAVESRRGVIEDVFEGTIRSHWPRSLQLLKNALSSALGQHFFLICLKWANSTTIFVFHLVACQRPEETL